MNIKLEPGTYVAAISGGVDSMVLLHLLAQKYRPSATRTDGKKRTADKRVRLVVAHYDHGIRPDADADQRLVRAAADKHGLTYVHDKGNLGPAASEAEARKARYAFLHRVRKASNARAIITAHHQDDMIETAVINMMRGTGRRGMTSLKSTDNVIRPLLHVPKHKIVDYAERHGISWREDPSNKDTKYLRNYIRHKVVPRMDDKSRSAFLEILHSLHDLNDTLDALIVNHLHMHPAADTLDRYLFITLPHAVSKEVMAVWLRHNGIRQYDKKAIERLVAAGKTMRPGTQADINLEYVMKARKNYLFLSRRDR